RSFLPSASSFACTLAQSRPRCRCMFFSKRVRSVARSSSRCRAFIPESRLAVAGHEAGEVLLARVQLLVGYFGERPVDAAREVVHVARLFVDVQKTGDDLARA